nr:glycosyltransferase [uncultured bacterium]AXL05805.1 glycosyltransferase [uncultured bacterium]
MGVGNVRVLLMAYGTRGDVEPLAGLAVRLRELGADVRVCVPPDEEFAKLLADVDVPMVPFGPSMRVQVSGTPTPESAAAGAARRAAELVAAHFGTVAEAAKDCDALVATSFMPAGARSVAEMLGIPYVYACHHPFDLPSAHYPPTTWPSPLFPPDVTDYRELWDLDGQRYHRLFGEVLNSHRAAVGLPPVDNVRDHVFTDRPWLAMDPVLGPSRDLPDLDVVRTGAWLLADERPLPAELEAFLDAGPPPVYVGFGSMPMHTSDDPARIAVDAIRAQGHRVLVSRGWAGLALIDNQDDCFALGETNHQALFTRVAAVVHHGGAGTVTKAARAGAPQVLVPQHWDQLHWGKRVPELGIGATNDGQTPTFESLSAALKAALTPETRARASDVAAMIRTDGTTVAAELLLDMVNR